MTKASSNLKELACVIGWKLVNDDKGFSTYEYETTISKYEKLSYIVRILEQPSDVEVYEILATLIKVLPKKLKRKIKKLISKFKLQDLQNMVELAIFAVDEYRNATEYSKLREYGLILGVDIKEIGYPFEYKLRKNKKAEIISIIELKVPMELAPTVGKLKKIDYKIAFVKNSKIANSENE